MNIDNLLAQINTTRKYGNKNNRANTTILDKEIKENYLVIANYYCQKKLMFIRYIARQELDKDNKIQDGFKEAMDNLIIEEWKQINNAILKNESTMINRRGHMYNVEENKEKIQSLNLPKYIEDRLLSGKGDKNIYSELGFAYEDFLADKLHSKIFSIGDAAVDQVLNQMLQQIQQTGDYKSNSSVRMNQKEIRPDLGWGMTKKGDFVGDKKTGLSAELQVSFNISSAREQILQNPQNIENYPEILQQYLNSNMYGFSVKRWDKQEAKQLTGAKGIQTLMNNIFRQSDNHTWNAIYAYHTMLLYISRSLLDILGPVNIAYITGLSFVWADQFVQESLFYMNMYAHQKYGQDDAEIKPYINSGNIYVRHVNQNYRNNILQNARFQGSSGSDQKGYYLLKFKVNDK